MTATKETLALLSSDHLQNLTGPLDTEMTGLLTPKQSNRSRSSSLTAEVMSSYPASYGSGRSGRDRGGRESFSRPGYDAPGSWRTRESAPSPSDINYGGRQYGHGISSNQYDTNAPSVPGSYSTQSRPRSVSVMAGESSVPLSRVCPGNVWPTEEQVNTAYAYGLRNDDGTISRLIAANTLGGVDHIPPQQGAEGLIILPPPRQLSPNSMRGRPEPLIPGHVSSKPGPYSFGLLTSTGCYRTCKPCSSSC
jgi:hypothetical protein